MCNSVSDIEFLPQTFYLQVNHLDSTVEEVSLQDIHMRKAFKSNVVFDQQIFSRDTMPTAMLETYQVKYRNIKFNYLI